MGKQICGRRDYDKKDKCSMSPSSSSAKYLRHQNIQPVFVTFPPKILSLMKVKSAELGQQQMNEFVEQGLAAVSQQQQDESPEVKFWDTMYKNNAPTLLF